MHFIINHVVKFDNIDNTNCSFLVETISRFTIIQVSMTHHWNTCLCTIAGYLISCSSVEDRRSELHTEFLTSPAKNSFIYLSKVHTTWYTQWIQYNVNWCSIFKEWHVFSTND